ncbi:hypothetical protein EHYA_01406 [Embleya hyalina]|uniref:Uncharacterized protein n=1 Tax=Embleya hyalina TaxID=516124 RepID=A0A401YGS6_9ACTN|nr:hypothetical protein EHYA_01406 [Embleya hyalina]
MGSQAHFAPMSGSFRPAEPPCALPGYQDIYSHSAIIGVLVRWQKHWSARHDGVVARRSPGCARRVGARVRKAPPQCHEDVPRGHAPLVSSTTLDHAVRRDLRSPRLLRIARPIHGSPADGYDRTLADLALPGTVDEQGQPTPPAAEADRKIDPIAQSAPPGDGVRLYVPGAAPGVDTPTRPGRRNTHWYCRSPARFSACTATPDTPRLSPPTRRCVWLSRRVPVQRAQVAVKPALPRLRAALAYRVRPAGHPPDEPHGCGQLRARRRTERIAAPEQDHLRLLADAPTTHTNLVLCGAGVERTLARAPAPASRVLPRQHSCPAWTCVPSSHRAALVPSPVGLRLGRRSASCGPHARERDLPYPGEDVGPPVRGPSPWTRQERGPCPVGSGLAPAWACSRDGALRRVPSAAIEDEAWTRTAPAHPCASRSARSGPVPPPRQARARRRSVARCRAPTRQAMSIDPLMPRVGLVVPGVDGRQTRNSSPAVGANYCLCRQGATFAPGLTIDAIWAR